MQLLQFVILGFLFSVNSALECYDCDPLSYGECLSPVDHDIKITQCEQVKGDMPFCFSIDFTPEDETIPAGIYRGCSSVKGLQLPCDYLKKQLTNGNVTSCKMCGEDRCNIAYL